MESFCTIKSEPWRTRDNPDLLHKKERNPSTIAKPSTQSTVTKGLINFRNWMIRQLAGGCAPYKNNPTMPQASNDVIFDVWKGHTKYCKYVRRMHFVGSRNSLCFHLCGAACMAVVRLAKRGVFGNLATTLGLAGVGLIVNKLIGMFYRYEYSHAHND